MFDIPIYLFSWIKKHPLKTSNKKTYIPLLINLFISLINLDIHSKHQIKDHSCKFKIDKITQSLSLKQHDVSKRAFSDKPLVYT